MDTLEAIESSLEETTKVIIDAFDAESITDSELESLVTNIKLTTSSKFLDLDSMADL